MSRSAARTLFPYGMTALLVVAGSLAALVASLEPWSRPPPSGGVPTPTPTAAGGWAASAEPRIAYWRPDPDGRLVLWAEELGGARRTRLHDAGRFPAIRDTTWRPDGGGLSYVADGRAIVVIGLDGSRGELTLPVHLDPRLRSLVDHRWSPESSRISATLRDVDGTLDVYVVDAATGSWSRVTERGDVLAGPWVDGDELLVETASGILGLVQLGSSEIRPVTGMAGISPVVASDGRIHFLGGDFIERGGIVGPPAVPFSRNARVYSMTADGGDVRVETTLTVNSLRLVSALLEGAHLVRFGSSRYGLISDDSVQPTVIPAGGGQRLVSAPDGRLFVFDGRQVLELDLAALDGSGETQLGRSELDRLRIAPRVLLDDVRDGDIWSPRDRSVQRGVTTRDPSVPPFRAAFALGGDAWVMDPSGRADLVARSHVTSSLAAEYLWWLANGNLLVWRGRGPGGGHEDLLLVAADGEITPVGGAEAVVVAPGGDLFLAARSAVAVAGRFAYGTVYDQDGASLEDRGLPDDLGRDPIMSWTRRGIYYLGGRLDGGPPTEPGGMSVDETVQLEGLSSPVTSAPEVAAAVRTLLGISVDTGTEPRASFGSLIAAPDGERLVVTVQDVGAGYSQTWLVLLDEGGELVGVLSRRASDVRDVAWSEHGYLGMSQFLPPATHGQSAVIRDRDGTVMVEVPGRFAGWTPDGRWFLVAGPGGLFAHPLDLPERRHFVSPIGVPVVTTRPAGD